ncbi:MAG: hypothetical protein KC441_05470 [Anaerolineales bacterium]|nr:hypothetical protein [Anaerolineales bacterium]
MNYIQLYETLDRLRDSAQSLERPHVRLVATYQEGDPVTFETTDHLGLQRVAHSLLGPYTAAARTSSSSVVTELGIEWL